MTEPNASFAGDQPGSKSDSEVARLVGSAMEPHDRRRAVRMLLLGLPIFAGGIVWYVFASQWLKGSFTSSTQSGAYFMAAPLLVGYAMVIAGLWGAVMDTRGERRTIGWSILRILFGLVATFGLLIIVFLAASLYARLAEPGT